MHCIKYTLRLALRYGIHLSSFVRSFARSSIRERLHDVHARPFVPAAEQVVVVQVVIQLVQLPPFLEMFLRLRVHFKVRVVKRLRDARWDAVGRLRRSVAVGRKEGAARAAIKRALCFCFCF